jgi:ketosteroid isomerase-like protein
MSQENVEIVRRSFEAQGTSAFFDFLDPHVVWINHAFTPEIRTYLGHEGVLEWFTAWRAQFRELRYEAAEVLDAGGDQVLVVTRVSATGVASGIPVESEFSTLFTLMNGKIVRAQGFQTRREALEAAGLSE